jgi:hypothetical protein
VLYRGDGTPMFHTGTHGNPGAGLLVENDGRVVVHSPTLTVLWASDNVPGDVGGAPAQPRRTAVATTAGSRSPDANCTTETDGAKSPDSTAANRASFTRAKIIVLPDSREGRRV